MMDVLRSIEIEIIRTNDAIALLVPSPNRDVCELHMLRACMKNITKIMDRK